jgi:hypothetical protein
MKTIRIDGRPSRVFVLLENETRLVYIPVKSCFLYDYRVLLEIEKQGGEMMKSLSKHTLDNGRNALVQYDKLIQVMNKSNNKDTGSRLKKPEENLLDEEIPKHEELTMPKAEDEVRQPVEEQKPARRKPGPKPKSKS